MEKDNKFYLLLQAYFNVLVQELETGDKEFIESQLDQVTKNIISKYILNIPKDNVDNLNDKRNNIELVIREFQESKPFRFILEQYNKLIITALTSLQSEGYVHIVLNYMNIILCQVLKKEKCKNLINAYFNQYYSLLEYCLKKDYNSEAVQVIYNFLTNFIEGISEDKFDYRLEYDVIFCKYFRLYGQLIIINKSYKVFSSFCEICARASLINNSKRNFLYREFSLFAAFSIFKRQIQNIYLIWEAKQPEDSIIQYTGTDLFPQNITDLVVSFSEPISLIDNYIPLEGKYNSRKYLAWYFFLVLLKINRHHLFNSDIIFNIGNIGIRQLHLILSIVSFVQKSVSENQALYELSRHLKFDDNDIQQGISILNNIKLSLKSKEKELLNNGLVSDECVNEYKQRFVNAFSSVSIFRILHLFFVPKISYSLTDNISVFLDETGGNYLNAGEPTGLWFAEQENNIVLQTIINNSSISHYPLEDFYNIKYEYGKALAVIGEEICWKMYSEKVNYERQKSIGNFKSCGILHLNNTKILTLKTPCGMRLNGVLLFISDDVNFDFSKLIVDNDISDKIKLKVNKIENSEDVTINIEILESFPIQNIKVLYYRDIKK